LHGSQANLTEAARTGAAAHRIKKDAAKSLRITFTLLAQVRFHARGPADPSYSAAEFHPATFVESTMFLYRTLSKSGSRRENAFRTNPGDFKTHYQCVLASYLD
jgi:hypothetical protein